MNGAQAPMPRYRPWLDAAGLVVVTMAVVVILYTASLLALARLAWPHAAAGSLVTDGDGRPIGSSLIAQPFTWSGYFWPRPSAVSYNGAGSGGSNLSPAGEALRLRVVGELARFDAAPGVLVPAELVTASGSGLDPHLTLAAALLQVSRVAEARGLDPVRVRRLVETEAAAGRTPGRQPLLNVLGLNLALDRMVRGDG